MKTQYYKQNKECTILDGYQDLTNRLQQFLNSTFRTDISKVKKEKKDFEKNVEKKLIKMEQKIQYLEEDKFIILEKILKLEEENQNLLNEIKQHENRDNQIHQTNNLSTILQNHEETHRREFHSIQINRNEVQEQEILKILKDNIDIDGKFSILWPHSITC